MYLLSFSLSAKTKGANGRTFGAFALSVGANGRAFRAFALPLRANVLPLGANGRTFGANIRAFGAFVLSFALNGRANAPNVRPFAPNILTFGRNIRPFAASDRAFAQNLQPISFDDQSPLPIPALISSCFVSSTTGSGSSKWPLPSLMSSTGFCFLLNAPRTRFARALHAAFQPRSSNME